MSQGEFNMPRNHTLWSSAHIKAIFMKIIFNSEKSGPAKTGLARLVATALVVECSQQLAYSLGSHATCDSSKVY